MSTSAESESFVGGSAARRVFAAFIKETTFNDVRELFIATIQAEAVDADATRDKTDEAYNRALSHAVAALRAIKFEQLGLPPGPCSATGPEDSANDAGGENMDHVRDLDLKEIGLRALPHQDPRLATLVDRDGDEFAVVSRSIATRDLYEIHRLYNLALGNGQKMGRNALITDIAAVLKFTPNI